MNGNSGFRGTQVEKHWCRLSMHIYRKYEEEDAIVSEVVLGNPGPITKFAQEVEANKPKIIIMNK